MCNYLMKVFFLSVVTLYLTEQKQYYTYGFAPNNHQQHTFHNIHSSSLLKHDTNLKLQLPLYAKAKGGRTTRSMAEKRKKRGRKVMPKIMERPKILDELPKPDQWDKIDSSNNVKDEKAIQKNKKEEEIARSKAAALIALQKRSVEVLTHVRSRVESLPSEDIVKAMNGGTYIVFDDILGTDLCSEMKNEGQTMYLDNKLELDLASGVTSGEYVVPIKGGQEQYADCPRSVEYVVSLTRHLAGMLNKLVVSGSGEDTSTSNAFHLGYKLDETASISNLRVFDRKARLSSLALLTGKDHPDEDDSSVPDMEEKRQFSCVVDKSSGDVDLRRVTVIYFMIPDDWDGECGGGTTFRKKDGNEISVEAKNDRLLLFSSEKSPRCVEKWIGKNGIEGACSCIVTHLLQQRQ